MSIEQPPGPKVPWRAVRAPAAKTPLEPVDWAASPGRACTDGPLPHGRFGVEGRPAAPEARTPPHFDSVAQFVAASEPVVSGTVSLHAGLVSEIRGRDCPLRVRLLGLRLGSAGTHAGGGHRAPAAGGPRAGGSSHRLQVPAEPLERFAYRVRYNDRRELGEKPRPTLEGKERPQHPSHDQRVDASAARSAGRRRNP